MKQHYLSNLCILIICMICIKCFIAQADSNSLRYGYDGSGNRISRSMVVQNRGSGTLDDNEAIFNVFPCITDGVVTIEVIREEPSYNYHFRVVDLQGDEVQSGFIVSQVTTLILSQQGFYLLYILDDKDNIHTFKIIRK